MFGLAIAMTLVSAVASLLRGQRYVHEDAPAAAGPEPARTGATASR